MTAEVLGTIIGVVVVTAGGLTWLHSRLHAMHREAMKYAKEAMEYADQLVTQERYQVAQLYTQRADFTSLAAKVEAMERTLVTIDGKIDRLLERQ